VLCLKYLGRGTYRLLRPFLISTGVCALSVAPETVKIRIEPEELRPGMEAAIICDSSSSNPPAKLSWWKDGIPIEGTYGMAWPAWLFGPGQAIWQLEVCPSQFAIRHGLAGAAIALCWCEAFPRQHPVRLPVTKITPISSLPPFPLPLPSYCHCPARS